jgi:hypothetical protein
MQPDSVERISARLLGWLGSRMGRLWLRGVLLAGKKGELQLTGGVGLTRLSREDRVGHCSRDPLVRHGCEGGAVDVGPNASDKNTGRPSHARERAESG